MSVRRSRSGGMLDREDIEAIIEILAKTFFLDHLQQVAIGRGEHANIDVDLFDAADAADLFFLQGTQEFCLEGNIELADLIQKKRSVVGDLEQSFFVGDRTGERSFFVTEQFRFEQVLVDRRTVHCLKNFV